MDICTIAEPVFIFQTQQARVKFLLFLFNSSAWCESFAHGVNWTLLDSAILVNKLCLGRGALLPEEKQSASELDAVLQHHHSLQEKLAEEMLHLARNLKNNTLVAQNVIKQDNQTLSQSLRLADRNFEKLKDESERLEQHAKKSVNWLLWLMLIVVCFIFISMILFIRIFPKLR
uniref:Vesicle transport protein USE1 n=1 Tax=Anolis carolinensis TaxID=28377 RepID=A0A803SZK7_ANOCA